MAAVASASVIISGTARQRDARPRATRGHLGGVARCRPASRRGPRRPRGRRSAGRRRRRVTSTPIAVSICSAMPRTCVPPTMGERPTTGAGSRRAPRGCPGTPRIVPTRHDRVGRRQHDQVGVGDRVDDAGARASSRPGRPRPRPRPAPRRAAAPSTPGSARPGGRSGSSGSAIAMWVSTRSSVIGSSRHPGLPAPAQRLGHLGERVAGVEHLGADQVGGDVAVAEAEPGRLDAVRRQLLLDAPGLVAPAPAALGVDAVAEGVHHGVEVGADLEPVDPQVVGGVGDDRDLRVGRHAGQRAGARWRAGGPGGTGLRPCRRTAP